jgi:V/A-type H+-transporting ATPase subunit A
MERQRYMLNFVMDICSRDFLFEEFEEVRDFFKNLINLVTQMNFSEFKSEAFNDYEEKVIETLKENTATHESEGIS